MKAYCRTWLKWVVVMLCTVGGVNAGAATIYWSNAQGTWNWNHTDTNWSSTAGLTGPHVAFHDGDNVYFGSFSGRPTAGTVTIESGGVGPGVVNSQQGFSDTFTLTGGDITGATASVTLTRDNYVNFTRNGSYTFGGGVSINSGGGTAYGFTFAPTSAGTYGFGSGTILITLGGFVFNPAAAATLTNDVVINGVNSTIYNGANGIYTGKITVNTTGISVPSGNSLKNTNVLGIIITTNVNIQLCNYPSGGTLTSMVTGPGFDVTLGNGGAANNNWTSRLLGNGGWQVRNVIKAAQSSLEVYDNPTAFFTNITGKVSVQAGVVERAYNTTPTGIYDITAWYELLITPAQSGWPTGTVRAATINVTGGGTVSGVGRLSCTTANIGTAGTVGTLAPGTNTPGTLYVQGNLVLGTNAILNVDLGTPGVIGSGTNDLIDVTGNLSVTGGTVNVTAASGFGEGTNVIIRYTGTSSGSGTLAIGTVPNHYRCSVTNDTTAKQVKVITKLWVRGTALVIE